ncbi:MAG: hypothetical protein IJW03_04570 [Clostridia bacterium]|nr:hypothetical protein [Clostridia bacterium]
MNSIGDKVVYGASGVMCIVDIREETISDMTRRYYVLTPLGQDSPSQTFVPTDSEMLVGLMRPLLSREDVDSVLRLGKEAPDIDWCADNRRRSDCFKKILESGDRVKMIAMIRTIHRAGLARESLGKRNYLSDDTVMKRAEKLLSSELSAVLGIDEEKARELVMSCVSE